MLCILLVGERERSLPSRPNGAIFLYIYLYPALMYAVMFYVILNKRKLHFPLAKNVMHSPSIYVYRYISGVDVCRNVLRNSK